MSTDIDRIRKIEEKTPLPKFFNQIEDLILKHNRKMKAAYLGGGEKEIKEYKKVRQDIINFFHKVK